MINNLIEYAKQQKLDLEVYAIKNNEITIEYKNDELANYKLQDIKEYKLKAIIAGISVTTTVMDISNPKEVLDLLKMARELTDELDTDSLAEQEQIENSLRKKEEYDIKEIKKNLMSINKEIKEKYPEVISISSCFNFEEDKYEIYNTYGVNLEDYNYHGYYMADIVMNIKGEILSCSKFLMAKSPDFYQFKQDVLVTIENTYKKYNARSLVTNKYNIILKNKSVFDILNAFSGGFHAQNINKKQSAFAGKLNQQIFSQKINIVEDPTNPELIGTRLFDSDGVKTYFKKVVENGIFKTELYDKKYAGQDGVKSTGNSYGVRNLYITPGEKNIEDLISEISNGIYVDEVIGLHSGINHITGDISLQCEGYMIEDGKITNGLKQIILSTNIFELFGNVKEVANDLEFFSSYGGSPSIVFENITIAGKEV